MLRMGELTGATLLTPWIRLYGPDGVKVGDSFGALAADIEVRAPLSGTFTVVASDGSAGLGNTGNYRLTLAKTGSPIVVSAGDEGQPG